MRTWILGAVVVIFFLLLLAISLPCLMPSKVASGEVSAVRSLRTITAAEETYRAAYGHYTDSLASLGGGRQCHPSAETACLLDRELASGTKFGYRFAVVKHSSSEGPRYVVGAAPIRFAIDGVRLFCVTNDEIRVDPNRDGSTVPPGFEQCSGFKPLQ